MSTIANICLQWQAAAINHFLPLSFLTFFPLRSKARNSLFFLATRHFGHQNLLAASAMLRECCSAWPRQMENVACSVAASSILYVLVLVVVLRTVINVGGAVNPEMGTSELNAVGSPAMN